MPATRRVTTERMGAASGETDTDVLSGAELLAAKKFFAVYDYDRDGYIDVNEMADLLLEMNLPIRAGHIEEIVKTLFAKYSNRPAEPNQILFREFQQIYKLIIEQQPSSFRKPNQNLRLGVDDIFHSEQLLREVFTQFDADESGYLDQDELRNVLKTIGLQDPYGDDYQSLVAIHFHADNISENKVDFHEFVECANMLVDVLHEG
eukprot:GEMP01099537.1.p1 GENE.GEMP01099537.1~~GEMP01099537.1.p1  ORF type:complete len:205 (+),score=37.46 GEMP01099537.1:74-688(+)